MAAYKVCYLILSDRISLLQFIICSASLHIEGRQGQRDSGVPAKLGRVSTVFWHQMTDCELGLAHTLRGCQIQSVAVRTMLRENKDRLCVKLTFHCFYGILICF